MSEMAQRLRLLAQCATELNTQHRPECAGMVDYDKGCNCGAAAATNVKLLLSLIITHLDTEEATS